MKYLSSLEKEALLKATENLNYEMFLFGSRVTRCGGDIDLLVLTPALKETERFKLSSKIILEFQKICDEKIDVLVLDPTNLTKENKAFLKLINKTIIK